MSFDRDRAGAWATSLGDHPHAPIVKMILDDRDRAAGREAELEERVTVAVERCHAAELRAHAAAEDAARLAGWIIAHPHGGDPAEVLNLHDRTGL